MNKAEYNADVMANFIEKGSSSLSAFRTLINPPRGENITDRIATKYMISIRNIDAKTNRIHIKSPVLFYCLCRICDFVIVQGSLQASVADRLAEINLRSVCVEVEVSMNATGVSVIVAPTGSGIGAERAPRDGRHRRSRGTGFKHRHAILYRSLISWVARYIPV